MNESDMIDIGNSHKVTLVPPGGEGQDGDLNT